MLIAFQSKAETADKFNLTESDIERALQKSIDLLVDVRARRPLPHRDDKMITSWNALMISGYAKASIALNDRKYADRASLAIDFIKKYLRVGEHGDRLLRSAYRSKTDGVCQT